MDTVGHRRPDRAGNPRRAHCDEAGVMQPEKFAGQMLETLLIFRAV